MRHAIDPKVDCVFKALLGAEQNRNLLIHFLNAFLADELANPITSVEILNPFNEKEFLSDKLSVVDVKAKDSQERLYQIEIQLTHYPSLPARMLYNWADIYSQQLTSGQDYTLLQPVYAIWLLAENVLTANSDYCHHYKLRNQHGNTLVEHGGIWLLELNKFHQTQIADEAQRWLKFFKDGAKLNDTAMPDWMQTPEMRQAMNTLSLFSEKEREYFAYQARQDFLREQSAIKADLARQQQQIALNEQQIAFSEQQIELMRIEKEQALREKEQVWSEKLVAEQREADAQREIAQLKALLAQKNSQSDAD